MTGGTKNDARIKGIVGTFWALKEQADFENKAPIEDRTIQKPDGVQTPVPISDTTIGAEDNVELRLGYTINLNLPETTDPEVFNAIFKALRDNLLKNP